MLIILNVAIITITQILYSHEILVVSSDTRGIASLLAVVIKVNLCGGDAGNLQQLSLKMNDLHDKAKQRSDTKERAIRQLIDSDIEILHFHMDRQAVLCFWCKSEKGHEHLRTLCESTSIVRIISDLTKNNSSAPELIRSKLIDVDIDQFKKTIGKF